MSTSLQRELLSPGFWKGLIVAIARAIGKVAQWIAGFILAAIVLAGFAKLVLFFMARL
jgi:hypothetical protein